MKDKGGVFLFFPREGFLTHADVPALHLKKKL